MHRYLVVANQTLESDDLMDLARERIAAGPAEFWLVVPATPVKDLVSSAMAIPMPVMGGVPTIPGPPAEARRSDLRVMAALPLRRLRRRAAAWGGDRRSGSYCSMRVVPFREDSAWSVAGFVANGPRRRCGATPCGPPRCCRPCRA